MPPLTTSRELWTARVDNLAFWMFSIVLIGVQMIFFFGDILMSGRLLIIGALATLDRIRGSSAQSLDRAFQPPVAVLIPAYNEEKVIERTIRSVLASSYPNLRVIVIDDGSRDRTLEIARSKFSMGISAGKVVVLTKPNSGKASALNYGLENARFIAPVRAGARVRNRVVLKGLEDRGDGRILLTLLNTIESDGEPKPALVAETLALLMGTPRVDTSAQP